MDIKSILERNNAISLTDTSFIIDKSSWFDVKCVFGHITRTNVGIFKGDWCTGCRMNKSAIILRYNHKYIGTPFKIIDVIPSGKFKLHCIERHEIVADMNEIITACPKCASMDQVPARQIVHNPPVHHNKPTKQIRPSRPIRSPRHIARTPVKPKQAPTMAPVLSRHELMRLKRERARQEQIERAKLASQTAGPQSTRINRAQATAIQSQPQPQAHVPNPVRTRVRPQPPRIPQSQPQRIPQPKHLETKSPKISSAAAHLRQELSKSPGSIASLGEMVEELKSAPVKPINTKPTKSPRSDNIARKSPPKKQQTTLSKSIIELLNEKPKNATD